MQCYSAFGLTIASELDLPDLTPADKIDPDVIIRQGCVTRQKGPAGLHHEDRSFRDTGVFRISCGREIIVDPLPLADPTRVRAILTGTVMAYLLRQRGWFPLHGSGVTVRGKTALFLGPSGAGKSTAAAAFFASGHRVISDDVCPVRVAAGRCWLQPSPPRIRLTDESRPLLENMGIPGEFQVDKHSYRLESTSVASPLAPVDRIYILEPGSAVGVKPASQLQAVTLLSANSFTTRRRMTRESLDIHIRDCVSVATVVPVAHFVRSQSLEDLKTMVHVVVEDLCE